MSLPDAGSTAWDLVFWYGVTSPSHMLRLALVCRAFNNKVKSDLYWRRFRNALLEQLPCLTPLFAGDAPIWRIYRQHLVFGSPVNERDWIIRRLMGSRMHDLVRRAIFMAYTRVRVDCIAFAASARDLFIYVHTHDGIVVSFVFAPMYDIVHETVREHHKRLRRSVGDADNPPQVHYQFYTQQRSTENPMKMILSPRQPLAALYKPFMRAVRNLPPEKNSKEEILG